MTTTKTLIPFDLTHALAGAKIVTRKNKAITAWHYFPDLPKLIQPVIAIFDNAALSFTVDGCFFLDKKDSYFDLFLEVEIPQAKKYYMNVWEVSEHTLIGSVICTKEQCDQIKEQENSLPNEGQRKFYKTVEISLEQP